MVFRPPSLAAVAVLAGVSWAFEAQSRSPSAPLPDIPALLTEVQKNQKAIDALVEQYACRKKEEDLEPTKGGGARTKAVKEYEVFYLAGREVDRLVGRDGRPLPPDEQQAENARVEKKVQDLLRKQEKQNAREARGGKSGKEPGISTFLRVERFFNPRREEFRGQNVVAFDFEPNPDYHAMTRLETLIQKLVGRAWVDDQAKEIVKLEAHLRGSVKFGGGLLASIHEGSAFVFEQTFVNDEVWLPSYVESHIQARLLFKGLRQDEITHYSDYKKFRVETVATPGRGKTRSR
jgi:hypothetical protein